MIVCFSLFDMDTRVVLFFVFVFALPVSVVSTIFGVALVKNGPAMASLAKVDEHTGNVTIVGPVHAELDGMGDLTTLDAKGNMLYYLGDTAAGTTLVGLSLLTGEEVCRGSIPFREVEFVGIAQSIDWDSHNNNLVLSGLNNNVSNPGHTVYRTKGCTSQGRVASITKVGTFGEAVYAPMLHASAFDAERQRLFITVAPTKDTFTVGMLELDKAEEAELTVFPADPTGEKTLLGMQFDPFSKTVVGVYPNAAGGIDLHSLAVDSEKRSSWNRTTLPKQNYTQLYGNEGSVSALDTENRLLYVLAAQPADASPNSADSNMHLLQIDIQHLTIEGAPSVTGLPLGSDTLLEMNFLSRA